jgi:sugar/nucleoside kinase (ribokinase family)
MERAFDCAVCGSCVADILVRPIPLNTTLGGGRLIEVEPLKVTTGGITCNAGIALARLGIKARAFSYVGNDVWGSLIR